MVAKDQKSTRLTLPNGEQAFVLLITIYLVLSIGFLLFTTSQLILTERIYPTVRVWWQAALVTGAIQAGFLLVPLTLVKGIALSRAQALLRTLINCGAIGCATLFLYWLWLHGDLAAMRSQMARSGAADLTDLANFSLRLANVEGKARAIAIIGEALGAIAVKLNIDYLRGTHLRYTLIPNPERAKREAEVEVRRGRVSALARERMKLALLSKEYERGIPLNRAFYRAAAESLHRDWDAAIHQMMRNFRRPGGGTPHSSQPET